MNYDAATWGALACGLSALGAAITWAAWRRRGAVPALRGLAWTLLPLAAWFTGTLRLITEVFADVAYWAIHLVFSPVVWLGIVLAGTSAVLFAVAGMIGRSRRASRADSLPRRAASRNARPSRAPRALDGTGNPGGDAGGDDLADIEAILRKHGIS
ncbi:MAG: hypothetical protein ACTHJH_10135 [Marmoricola sp.]